VTWLREPEQKMLGPFPRRTRADVGAPSTDIFRAPCGVWDVDVEYLGIISRENGDLAFVEDASNVRRANHKVLSLYHLPQYFSCLCKARYYLCVLSQGGAVLSISSTCSKFELDLELEFGLGTFILAAAIMTSLLSVMYMTLTMTRSEFL
jgi:hypothetical protein